ncbi:MAG: GNAT family N-acetyltransferase [Proteobacteria bacterium]|nr:GNAT family N-acetyltransferase [Pseudomonadota bacterium]
MKTNPLDIRDAAPGDLDALIALYEGAFLPSERKPSAVIRAMASNGAYRVRIARVDGAFAGFAILFRFPGGGLALLEYMAVEPGHRARGVGQALFHDATGAVAADETLIVEVEADTQPCPEQAERIRRKGFYRRLGCLEVEGLGYRVPLPGDPPPMNLLVRRPARGALDRATLSDWLARLYRDGYHTPADDPRLVAMLAALPEHTRLV